MFLVQSSTKSFDLVMVVFEQENGEHKTICNMTFISYMTKMQFPKRDDSINCFPPLKDTSNLSPRRILKFNIKADPNLYGNVPTYDKEDVEDNPDLFFLLFFFRFDLI